MSTTELTWFKSSYSGSGGDNCVEVAAQPHAVLVRDSKDPHVGRLHPHPHRLGRLHRTPLGELTR